MVLVTTDSRLGAGQPDSPRVRPPRPEFWIGASYVQAVRDAGGTPLLLPPGEPDLDAALAIAHAVVITGGAFDIHPSHYGEQVTDRIDRVDEARTMLELALARRCLRDDIPVLGVCGGMQVLAVAAGGTLVQDLPKQPIDHEQPNDPAEPSHRVRIEAPASAWLGSHLQVNSTHHQAVANPGGLVACGWSDDGVIEVIASRTHRFVLGVQWHPEGLGDLAPYRELLAR